MATGRRITSLRDRATRTIGDFPRYSRRDRYTVAIIARLWASIDDCERQRSRLNPKGGPMSKPDTFNLREWLVPPVLMPIFLVLLIAAAVLIQW